MAESGAVYGNALHDLAVESAREEQILKDLTLIADVLSAEPAYVRLLDSYVLSKAERQSLLEQSFGGKVDAMTLNLLKIMVDRNALKGFSQCRKAYVSAYREQHRIAVARISSAVELRSDQKEKIVSSLSRKTGKTIEPEYVVNPELRGGMRIEVDGVCYDNTVSAKLGNLARVLSGQG